MSRPTSNPLVDLHRQAEAEFQNYDQIEIVSTFGEPQAEYAAIRKSVGLVDLPQRGFIELVGPDSLSFLNGLISAETFNKETKRPLPIGRSAYSFMLNLKGRIVADLTVLSLTDRVLIELDARLAEPLAELFEEYRFAEEVKLRCPGDLHEMALHGPGAPALLRDAAATEVTLEVGTCGVVQLADAESIAWRSDPTGAPGLHLILPSAAARAVWMQFITTYGQVKQHADRRLRPVGWAAFNATRIEAGTPLFAVDYDGAAPATASPVKARREQAAAAEGSRGVLPAETGLLHRAVSLSKCYVGQEVVARMHARGQVARQIAGLRVDGDALPIAGEQIFAEDSSPIGVVTSSTISPLLSNTPVCLGMMKRPYFTVGTKVRIPAEGSLRTAAVVQLPFIKDLS